MEQRITIRDIAARANVHFTTVSLALRNNKRLPQATRDRIQALAEEMGYRPDPILGALNQYRHLRGRHQHQATLGWINNLADKKETARYPLLLDYYNGACQRAEKLGFKIDTIFLRAPEMSFERIHTILRSRNINGLLLAPQPRDADEINLRWEMFSAVKFGHSLQKPELHTIVSHQYQAMRTLLQELRRLGYRRIGVVIERDLDMRANNNWQAAFWVDYNAHPPENRVKPFFFSAKPRVDAAGFDQWFREQRPDVIGLVGHEFVETVISLGLKIPEEFGLAVCGTSSLIPFHPNPAKRKAAATGTREEKAAMAGCREGGLAVAANGHRKDAMIVSGVYEDRSKIGQMAVDLLVSMLGRQEVGIPEHPHYLLAEGNWLPGNTVRKQATKKAGTKSAFSKPKAGRKKTP